MSDEELLIKCRVKLAQSLRGEAVEVEAVELVEECINKGIPIPVELFPYVRLTINAWRRVKNKKNVRKNTLGKWRKLVRDVHWYWLVDRKNEEDTDSYKRALQRVVEENPFVYNDQEVTFETLDSHYRKKTSDVIKAGVDLYYAHKTGHGYGKE